VDALDAQVQGALSTAQQAVGSTVPAPPTI
jgi:hypothetical protein